MAGPVCAGKAKHNPGLALTHFQAALGSAEGLA